MSLALVSRLAASQRDAIAGQEPGVHEPEQRAPFLEVGDQAALDLHDAAAPKACSIALFQPYAYDKFHLIVRQPRLACHPSLANEPAHTLRRSPDRPVTAVSPRTDPGVTPG